MPFAPSGLITLTTDFGAADPFAGIVSGRILSHFPGARIIDLGHGMPMGRADLAGFWLGHAWREFPVGTVHLAVVDPGVGTARQVLLALAEDRLLLAPDNGLLAEALRECRSVRYFAMAADLPERLGLDRISHTFHGRDLFAPLAARLAEGTLPPESFGPPTAPADPAPLPQPARQAGCIAGEVLLADHFGNLFTNIGAPLIATCRQPWAVFGTHTLPVVKTYADAAPGAPLALVNAFGVLELAVNGASAAAEFGLRPGAAVRIVDGLET